MIFWLTVVFCVVMFIVTTLTANRYRPAVLEVINFVSIILGTIALVAAAVMLVIIGVNHYGLEGQVAENTVRREMLVYQLENDIYDNDNDLGKRELMVDIQYWNEDLAAYKENQDNFWIGIFTPDIYDQFEFIELEEIE